MSISPADVADVVQRYELTPEQAGFIIGAADLAPDPDRDERLEEMMAELGDDDFPIINEALAALSELSDGAGDLSEVRGG